MGESTRTRTEDLIAVLGSVPERVADLVLGLDDPRLDYRHAPAFQTVRELVGHVCEAGVAADGLLRQVIVDGRDEASVRKTFDPVDDPDLSPPVSEQLEDFGRVRRRSLDLLRGLPAQAWHKEVMDPAQGLISVQDACEQIMRHELGHLAQVRNLLTLLPDP
ncbi:MAG: DinB family protein [Candidatus Dormibacteraeota bacterium]|nr:DinB family protein [Candidatus Dormibacteraeota bacterium]